MLDLPRDPVLLLSFVNTELRDRYPSLTRLCAAHMTNTKEIIQKLASIDYEYDEEQNQFI